MESPCPDHAADVGGNDVDDDLPPLSACGGQDPARRAVALLVVPLAAGVAVDGAHIGVDAFDVTP